MPGLYNSSVQTGIFPPLLLSHLRGGGGGSCFCFQTSVFSTKCLTIYPVNYKRCAQCIKACFSDAGWLLCSANFG